MTLTSWFSSMRPSRRRLTQDEAHRSGSRAFRRRASFDALENRLVLSTVQFTSASETVNQTTGSFSVGVSLSSPPAGTVTVSNYAAIDTSDGIAVDKAGNLYVDDSNHNDVEEMTPAGWLPRWPRGCSGPSKWFSAPTATSMIAQNFDGVDQVTPTGQVTDIANGSMFDDPRGIAVDSSGNLYVANYSNGTVVKITPTGVVSRSTPPGLIIPTPPGHGCQRRVLFVADFQGRQGYLGLGD